MRNAAEQGFLHGLNEILMLGGILCLVGTAFALWLVREREIDRETLVDTAFEEAEPVRPRDAAARGGAGAPAARSTTLAPSAAAGLGSRAMRL